MEIPKIFWKYYDLFRRKLITLEEFSEKTSLQVGVLVFYLESIFLENKE